MKHVLLGVIIVWIGYFIFSHWTVFTRPFDAERMAKIYSGSQYVLGPKSTRGIGDDGLYAFAGYYYVFQGGDVSSVNFEHPPLGKYLIGLSIYFFHNENTINIIYFFALLSFTYAIGIHLLKNSVLALVAVGILSIHPLLLDHVTRSQLDLPFSVFFLGAVYFFLRSFDTSKYLSLSNLFWALSFSTRFFPLYIIIWVVLAAYIWIVKKNLFRDYIYSSVIVPIVYLACHISFFVYHPSFIEFLRHKKWMIAWFRGTPIIIGNIWTNIFTGNYLDSTGSWARNDFWIPFMPVMYSLAVLRFRTSMLKKISEIGTFLYAFTLFFLFYVTFATNGLQKFVMPIYPIVILLALSNLHNIYSIISKSHARLRSPGNKRKTH